MTTTRPAAPPRLPDTEFFTADDVLHHSGDRLLLDRALRRGEAVRVCRGVYARSRPDGDVERHRQLVRAVFGRPGHTGAVGGVSAALLHGLSTGLGAVSATVTVLRPGGGGPTADIDLVATRLPASHLCEVDGLPVSTLARTVVDVTRRENPGSLTGLVVTDSALRASADPEGLRRDCETVLQDLRGCTGLARTRSVLREATPHSAGPTETVSRALLQQMGIPTPLLDVTYRWDPADPADDTGPHEPVGIGPEAPFGSVSLTSSATSSAATVVVPFSWPDVHVLGVVLDRPVAEDGVPSGWSGDRDSWVAGPRRFLRRCGWVVVEWSPEDLSDPWPLSQRLTRIMRELYGGSVGPYGWARDHPALRPQWSPTGWRGEPYPDR